ncbi:MAG: hypothetical protein IJN92_10205 [Lachnospiraceae bacterium]|nr:hypothetical protein [Lachnospiraceae bacterium]
MVMHYVAEKMHSTSGMRALKHRAVCTKLSVFTSELENGHRQPSLKEMRAYSALFSVPLEYFSPSLDEDAAIPNMADKDLLETYMKLQELKEETPDLYQVISLLTKDQKGKAVVSLLSRYLNEDIAEENILLEGFKLLKDKSKNYTYNEALRHIWNQIDKQ